MSTQAAYNQPHPQSFTISLLRLLLRRCLLHSSMRTFLPGIHLTFAAQAAQRTPFLFWFEERVEKTVHFQGVQSGVSRQHRGRSSHGGVVRVVSAAPSPAGLKIVELPIQWLYDRPHGYPSSPLALRQLTGVFLRQQMPLRATRERLAVQWQYVGYVQKFAFEMQKAGTLRDSGLYVECALLDLNQ